MIYEKVSFDFIRKIVERIFGNENSAYQLALTPESINEFAALSGVKLKWQPILNWVNCFEHNTYEYTEQEFLNIAFLNINHSHGQTIILTDECFKESLAFSIGNFDDVIQFMETVYPTLFKMQFCQPSDFIFLQPDIGLISMIHHEGVVTTFINLENRIQPGNA